MTTSYNGWPASRDPKAIGVNQRWAPLGHLFPGGIKAGDVEVVMTWLVEQLHNRVERIDVDAVKDEWGYVYKQSANSQSLVSCHSSATAFDYNATRHPNGKRGTWSKVQVNEIHRILAELNGVVRWLGDATKTPDEMHFEIRGTPAQVAQVAARLRSPKPTPPPTPPAQEDDDMAVRIAWYQDPNVPGKSHAYSIFGNQAKYMAHIEDVNESKKMGVEEVQGDLPVHPFQGGVAFLDGPLKNV